MARIIFKLNRGGADEVGYYTEKDFRKFKDLMSRKYSLSFLKKDDVKRKNCERINLYSWTRLFGHKSGREAAGTLHYVVRSSASISRRDAHAQYRGADGYLWQNMYQLLQHAGYQYEHHWGWYLSGSVCDGSQLQAQRGCRFRRNHHYYQNSNGSSLFGLVAGKQR